MSHHFMNKKTSFTLFKLICIRFFEEDHFDEKSKVLFFSKVTKFQFYKGTKYSNANKTFFSFRVNFVFVLA